MSITNSIAYEVLGLPTFATEEEVRFRYRVLACLWYPERHNSSPFAIEQFRQISEAVACILHPEIPQEEPMKLLDMYQLFQSIFFRANNTNSDPEESDCDTEDGSFSDIFPVDGSDEERDELEAAVNANQLIQEEEQEKLKAERKKAKKKRRKERKKQQKATEAENPPKQKNPPVKQTSQTNNQEPKGKVKENKIETLSDSEEGIDPNSAFVAVIAKKHKRFAVPECNTKFENCNLLLPKEIKEDPTSVVLRSRQLALRANEMASLGHFSEAINLFSESIKLDPSDHRFYGNRSYCFDRLGQFERALKDAEKSIALCPSWPKGYYRKGRALLGLKKYAQAEECFVTVLKLDNDCEDAISEMHKVKVLQIMPTRFVRKAPIDLKSLETFVLSFLRTYFYDELGYSKLQAETALAKHSSVQESVESLLNSGISKLKTPVEVEVFISDDESDGFWACVPKSSRSPSYDVKMDPKNPENHNSLWIGNVQQDVTEKTLTTLFSKYGELLSVKAMPEKFCAFINYKNKNAPGKAMQALQGLELHGANLVIRFPNLPGDTGKKIKPVIPDASKLNISLDECYFWRTTGCVYGENCRHRHVKEHKGIDKKKWHIVS